MAYPTQAHVAHEETAVGLRQQKHSVAQLPGSLPFTPHGALGAGTYYWHVRSRSAWAQSDTSETRVLRIVQDLEGPLLQLDPPADAVMAGAWRLSGRTEPGASVYVDGVQIAHEGGRIDQQIDLRRGANIITVKAMDDVGNLNYASLAIFAK